MRADVSKDLTVSITRVFIHVSWRRW